MGKSRKKSAKQITGNQKARLPSGKRKPKDSIKNPMLQARMIEVPLPPLLMEALFDVASGIGYITEEQDEYRTKKQEYNKGILRKIRKIPFTDRQREVLSLMYGKSNLNYRETADRLGVIIGTVQEIRDAAFKKIRKAIIYDFKIDE